MSGLQLRGLATSPVDLNRKEIREQPFALGRQDRFRVKLHSVKLIARVLQAHDEPCLRPCGDPQIRWQRRFLDDQRVIATDFQRIRKSPENTLV